MSIMWRAIKARLRKRQKGFTLIELMTVMAILSVLSAVTFPAISGGVTAGKATTQSVDISSIQRASDWFKSEAVDHFPSEAAAAGVSGGWSAGNLPELDPVGTGGTATDPIVFDEDTVAGIDFNAVTTVNGKAKKFRGDYLRSIPDHGTETIVLGPGESSAIFKVKRRGEDVYVQLVTGAAVAVAFNAWGMVRNGEIWSFIDQEDY